MNLCTVTFPGLVDLQVNGFGGVDFNAADLTAADVGRGSAALRATGVTRFLPTLITGPFDRFAHCARVLIEAAAGDPAIAGIHMEGPYISPNDGARGAHPREHTAPASVDDFERRQEAASGRIVLVTIAPEVPGALTLIEHLVARGIRVAIGHTEALPATIDDAIAAGATLSTHLGNGCGSVLPRHPNVIWEQLARDSLHASLIVDGHHLPGATVKVMIRAKTPVRTILVTDAIAAAGCGPGHYRIGQADIEVSAAGRATLRGTSQLAGAALTMPDAIANTVRFTGMDIADAIRLATVNPAAYMGFEPAGSVTAAFDSDSSRLMVDQVSA